MTNRASNTVSRSGAPWPVRRIVLVAVAVLLALATSAFVLSGTFDDPARGAAAQEQEAQRELLKHAPEPAVLPKGKSKSETYAPG